MTECQKICGPHSITTPNSPNSHLDQLVLVNIFSNFLFFQTLFKITYAKDIKNSRQ